VSVLAECSCANCAIHCTRRHLLWATASYTIISLGHHIPSLIPRPLLKRRKRNSSGIRLPDYHIGNWHQEADTYFKSLVSQHTTEAFDKFVILWWCICIRTINKVGGYVVLNIYYPKLCTALLESHVMHLHQSCFSFSHPFSLHTYTRSHKYLMYLSTNRSQ